MKKIRLLSTDVGMACLPIDFLGNEFSTYLAATKSARMWFDREKKRQAGKIENLPDLIAALKSGGFEVSLDPELATQLKGKVSEAAGDREEIEQKFVQVEKWMSVSDAELFPFQVGGVKWLLSREKGALLADDMGLGKTLQSLMAVPENAPVLVLCPAVVKTVWQREVERFRPDLQVTVLKGKKSFRWPTEGEVVVINYDVLSGKLEGKYADLRLIDKGEPVPGTHLIVDEIHMCKNWKSLRAKRTAAIANMVRASGGFTIGTTGTPLVNRPMELWQVLSVLGLQWEAFSGWKNFLRLFEFHKGHWGGWEHGRVNQAVPGLLKKVMLHRRKTEVLKDLPEKQYQDIEVQIPPAGVLAGMLEDLAGKAGIDLNHDITEEDLQHLLSDKEHFKARKMIAETCIPAMMQVVEEYEVNEEPLVVFCCHLAPIDLLGAREGWEKITGEVSAERRADIIKRFQAGELKGLALTIGAGGVGITLTAASNVLFVDLDWTPAGNQQAEGRVHRIGQDKPVLIKRLIVDHPLVHRVLQLLQAKARLIDAAISAAARQESDRPLDGFAGVELDDLLEGVLEEVEVEKKTNGLTLDVDLTDTPSGFYAIVNTKGETNFYEVRKVAEGKWQDWVFTSRLVGGGRGLVPIKCGYVRPDRTIGGKEGTTVLSVLRKIAANPEEAMKRFGLELGICGRCGAVLTNEKSRERGIGPVCATKVGW